MRSSNRVKGSSNSDHPFKGNHLILIRKSSGISPTPKSTVRFAKKFAIFLIKIREWTKKVHLRDVYCTCEKFTGDQKWQEI